MSRRRIRKTGSQVEPLRVRLWLLALLAATGFSGLVARAVQLQALDGEWLAARAQAQHLTTLELGALRGEIVDRRGELLAVSTNVESVTASPRRIADPRTTARRLARSLGVQPADLEARLATRRSFVWIKRWVTPDEGDRVRRLDLHGVGLAVERRRLYPNGTLAAPYLGFAGRDEVGLSGLELLFDGTLRGVPSSVPVLKDAEGRKLVSWDGAQQPSRGARLVLTLDAHLQHVAERALDNAIARTKARHATVVLLDPWTGDLLAVADRPGFDPNRFWTQSPASFRSRAFTDPFEPGSTLKPFVMGVALEAGAIRPQDRIDCENGAWTLADRVIHDWKPYGILPARDVLIHSSNIGAAKIAGRVGSERLVAGLERFGLGQRTGSGFPGESAGIVHPLSERQVVELATLAFGQGMTATAIQLAAAGAALANGGYRVTPRLALRLEAPGGSFEWPSGRGERVLSEKAAATVLALLQEAVERGTGGAARVAGIEVAGKTGTAQKVANGRYAQDRFVASFLGFVPAESPRLVVMVVLDEPRHPHTGGGAAAPVFREVVRQAMGQLGLSAGGAG